MTEKPKLLKFHGCLDERDPAFICSLCQEVISEDEYPIRIHYYLQDSEMRFHPKCYQDIKDKDFSQYEVVWGD